MACRRLSSPLVLTWSLLCVYATGVSAYRDTSHIGVGLYPMTSFNFNFLHKGSISVQSPWELGPQNMKFGGHNSVQNTPVLHPVVSSLSLPPLFPLFIQLMCFPALLPSPSLHPSLSLLLSFPLSFSKLRVCHIYPVCQGWRDKDAVLFLRR